MKAGKVWGVTKELFRTPHHELHRIEVVPGGKCSKHLHQTKYNGFYVERGALNVTVWQKTGLVDVTTLRPGDTMVVPPGVYHQFEAETDVIAFESYWSELHSDDIIRETHGE